MQIGSRVTSRLYAANGMGIIIGFSELFGATYAEILFKDGSTVRTQIEDLTPAGDPIALLQNSQIDSPAAFLARQMLLRLQANISEKTIVTSANFKIQPLPHQLLAVNFVMNRFQPRSLIADEVGLGKTIEAILMYQEFKLRGIASKVLIVVPSGLVLQWHEELLSKFNEKFVIYSRDYIRTLKQSYGEETNVWQLHDKIIASIDAIKPVKIDATLDPAEKKRRNWHNRHVFEDITRAGFDIVIIDEAHKLSKHGDGHESARFKLGEKLSEAIPVLLLLTATPHQGDEHLFLNLLRLIDPVLFTGRQSLTPALVQEVAVRNQKRAVVDFDGKRIFRHRITSLIELQRRRPEHQDELDLYDFVSEYTGTYYNYARRTHNQMLMLLVMLYQRIVSSSSFALLDAMKRRLAFLAHESVRLAPTDVEDFEDQEPDLDALLSQSISSGQRELDIEKQFVSDCIARAEKLTRTFQECKFRQMLEVISEIKQREGNPDLKFLIFTEFRATQEAIIAFLGKLGYPCSYIHGSLSREEKVRQVELFRTTNAMMVSTDAGGEGINLQFCYCMINFDLPWNPARLEQRIGRIDRIGQTHHALIFNFHLTDTIEDRVRQVLERKLERIKTQFGEDKYADILSLLQDEFSFDRIYLDAIQLKAAESQQLDAIGDKIYRRAREILERDELLLPFSQFSQDARDLVNTELNGIIKNLVRQYFASKNLPINWYREEKDFCYFNNPFQKTIDEPAVYRNVCFDNAASTRKEKIEFINLEHPLIVNIRAELERAAASGLVAAFRISINKFQNISGFWFSYQLTIDNHLDRHRHALVTVFMEDEEFDNPRLSHYLEKNIIVEGHVIQNYQPVANPEKLARAAQKLAEARAGEIFTAAKLTWINEIDAYARKFDDYFRFKENAYNKIQIDNIRAARLKALAADRAEQARKFQLQRNIVPKLELCQVAFVEFV